MHARKQLGEEMFEFCLFTCLSLWRFHWCSLKVAKAWILTSNRAFLVPCLSSRVSFLKFEGFLKGNTLVIVM